MRRTTRYFLISLSISLILLTGCGDSRLDNKNAVDMTAGDIDIRDKKTDRTYIKEICLIDYEKILQSIRNQ